MKILALETSAVTCSAAFYDGERIYESFVDNGLNHSKTLMQLVDDVLKKADASVGDADVFACSNGPGSFTGVRIGVSAIKGMARAANKSCAGVSTLSVIAQSVPEDLGDGVIACVMDARRGQFYNALFERKGGVLTRLTEDSADSGENIVSVLAKTGLPVIAAGDGTGVFIPFLQSANVPFSAAEGEYRYQRASGVIKALQSDGGCVPVSPDGLTVGYLRPPQAEREYKIKNEQQS